MLMKVAKQGCLSPSLGCSWNSCQILFNQWWPEAASCISQAVSTSFISVAQSLIFKMCMFNFDKSLISGWIKINLTFQTALFLKAGYLWATELKISLPLSRCHRPVRGHSWGSRAQARFQLPGTLGWHTSFPTVRGGWWLVIASMQWNRGSFELSKSRERERNYDGPDPLSGSCLLFRVDVSFLTTALSSSPSRWLAFGRLQQLHVPLQWLCAHPSRPGRWDVQWDRGGHGHHGVHWGGTAV